VEDVAVKDLRPLCVFRSDHDNNSATPQVELRAQLPKNDSLNPRLRAGKDYQLECELYRTLTAPLVWKAKLTVLREDPTEAASQTKTFKAPAPDGGFRTTFPIDNTANAWIGKKPDDTLAQDTYAGLVDNVVISKVSYPPTP
jgi:hypothetical protein